MRYKEIINMPNFQINPIDLPLSEDKSKRRIEIAVQTLGEGVMRNLLGFALFLLGADRKMIATQLGIKCFHLVPPYVFIQNVRLRAYVMCVYNDNQLINY